MALADQELSPDFCVRVAVIARKRGTAQVDFEPIAWAHLSAENASRSQGHTERLQAGSITCENSNPERLDHGDSRFFLVSFSNVQARDAYLPHPDHSAFANPAPAFCLWLRFQTMGLSRFSRLFRRTHERPTVVAPLAVTAALVPFCEHVEFDPMHGKRPRRPSKQLRLRGRRARQEA